MIDLRPYPMGMTAGWRKLATIKMTLSDTFEKDFVG
jgi:hypothetical protein